MRVTDLARKIGLKTEELREQLARFKVAHDAKEVEKEKAEEIMAAFKDGAKPEAAEPEQDLMGFMIEGFDEDAGLAIEGPADEPAAAEPEVAVEPEPEIEAEKPEPAVSIADQLMDEPRNRVNTEPVVKPAEPAAVAAKPAEKKVEPAKPGFQRAEPSNQRIDARQRWAAAKLASERLIEVKKREEVAAAKRAAKQQQTAASSQAAFRPAAKQLVIDRNKPKRVIELGDSVSVREFGERLGVSPVAVVGTLFKHGVMSNLNAQIDFDTASIIAEDFWAEVKRDNAAVSGADLLAGNIAKLLEDEPVNLSNRPPIVAVMGHVDHGKTSLLDRIRRTDVVAGEAGGITQHIGAYQVEIQGRRVTFLDTPGHEAFTAMRARGARATDIAILVVASNEGVKPQTIEALNHAKEAGVPIIVALTKVDLPDSAIDRVKGELTEHGLQASDWGGQTEMIPVSAKSGQGIETLLETILLVNDLDPVKGNPNRTAVGTVIEAHLDKSQGAVATVLVNTGTLRVGDDFIIGTVAGRVKKMWDHNHKTVTAALPGQPVQIAGLTNLPDRAVGQILQVFPDAQSARAKAEEFAQLLEKQANKGSQLANILGRINSGELKELKIVLKADVEGSLEAVRASIEKLQTAGARPKIIHAGVGAVTETDVLMASAADGLIFAFNVPTPPQTERAAEAEKVSIRSHTIIYKLLEELEKLMTGLLDPEEVTVELGELTVLAVFFAKGTEQIVGGRVNTGHLETGARARIMRGGREIGEAKILQLKREQEAVKELREGFEGGVKVVTKNVKIQENDTLQAYKIEKKKAA